MLNNVAKHVTELYKKSPLPVNVIATCKATSNALSELRSLVGKIKKNQPIREALGNILITPISVRWTSMFFTVKNVIENSARIEFELEQRSATLLREYNQLMGTYRRAYDAYLRVIEPIAELIQKLEVIYNTWRVDIPKVFRAKNTLRLLKFFLHLLNYTASTICHLMTPSSLHYQPLPCMH
jgi:hypothetical protein